MVNISDSDLDLKIQGMLQHDCYPTHFNLSADFDKIVGKSNEEKDALNLPRYYISELIGIKPGDNPSYSVLDKVDAERTPEEIIQFRDFGIKILTLRDADEICDKEGVKFIAKFLVHYGLGEKQLTSIKPHVRDYVLGVIAPYRLEQLNIINLAKKLINEE